MAASTTTAFPGLITAPVTAPLRTRLDLRRRISPQAAHALDKLSSTIEYLGKQFLHQGGSLSAHIEELQAVELLMTLQREIYLECPIVPTFTERLLSLFRPREQ